MIRCENREERKQWAQCLVFLRDQFKRDKHTQVFEKFVAIEEHRYTEELFQADPQNYDYGEAKINQKVKSTASQKGFDLDAIQIANQDECGAANNNEGQTPGLSKQRSSERLSDSSDDESNPNAPRTAQPADDTDGGPKEEITDIFRSLADIVSTQDVVCFDPDGNWHVQQSSKFLRSIRWTHLSTG